jgi:hypothetical protein
MVLDSYALLIIDLFLVFFGALESISLFPDCIDLVLFNFFWLLK